MSIESNLAAPVVKRSTARLTGLFGDTYGQLTVLAETLPKKVGTRQVSKRQVLCKCTCGVTKTYTLELLRCGNTLSCGCLFYEKMVKHGHRRAGSGNTSDTYSCWRAMYNRCNVEGHKEYHRYGAKGIKIDPRWEDFRLFLEDMGERPSKEHSVDRIDSTLGYTKSNCRWATMKEQYDNRVTVRDEFGQFIKTER